jgi:hypothetical protein
MIVQYSLNEFETKLIKEQQRNLENNFNLMFKKVDVKSIIKVLKLDTNVSALTTTIKWGNPLKEPSVDYVVIEDYSPILIDSIENRARISVRIIS